MCSLTTISSDSWIEDSRENSIMENCDYRIVGANQAAGRKTNQGQNDLEFNVHSLTTPWCQQNCLLKYRDH